jgi:hypothetical protein
MQKLSSITDKLAGRAAILAGAAFAAGGVTQIVHSQRHAGNRVVGVAGYLALSFAVVALVSAAPSFLALARRARSGAATKAALAAAAGTAVLGVTSITSIVNGQDLSLFNVVAPLTNGAWLIGSIVLAVSLIHAGKVQTAVAVGLPIAWVATIPLATVGGGVIAGAYYLVVGHLLVNHAVERTAPAAAQPATAPQPERTAPHGRPPPTTARAVSASSDRTIPTMTADSARSNRLRGVARAARARLMRLGEPYLTARNRYRLRLKK